MKPLYFVSSPAAAGKTYVMVRAAHSRAAAGKNVLIVLPTLRLIDEVTKAFIGLEPRIEPEVHNSETTSAVTSAILTALRDRPVVSRVLIVTSSALSALPFFPAKEKWTVFVDEVPQVYSSVDENVPDTHHYLTAGLELHPLGPVYGRLLVNSAAAMRGLSTTDDVVLCKVLGPAARMIMSPNLETYTPMASYQALCGGTGRKLKLHFILRPALLAGFERVTILSANFENSLLYQIWSTEGQSFLEDKVLSDQLRYREHQNGDLVTINFALEKPWSKRARDSNDRAQFNAIVDRASSLLEDKSFIWDANKDIADDIFRSPAVRLPSVSHGLNSFDHIHNVVCLSARNPTPEQFKFLEWLGVPDSAVRRAVHFDALYQIVLRCSLRDVECQEKKLIIVPDRPSAEHLHRLLPGSAIQKLDLGIVETSAPGRGRPRKHDDVAARVRAHRAEQARRASLAAAIMMDEYNEFTTDIQKVASEEGLDLETKSCNEIPYKGCESDSVTQQFHGSLFNNMKATDPYDVVSGIDVESFIKALKMTSTEVRVDKADNYLISPAMFDADLTDATRRGIGNVVLAQGIWLDVDVGDMTHAAFAATFPHLRIVCFNSFSSTKKKPRYRLYIPTDRVMLAGEYQSLTKQIVQVIEDSGFSSSREDIRGRLGAHGIDMSKLHAASLFYLPCKPKDASGKIWRDYAGGGRKPIDVDAWLEHAVPMVDRNMGIYTEPRLPHSSDIRVDRDRAQSAIERWNIEGVQPGKGDSEMFRLALELEKASLPLYEAKMVLESAARSATSPHDRLRQAEAILRSRRYRYPH